MSKAILRCNLTTHLRKRPGFSTKPKTRVIPDHDVITSIQNEEYKPRKHPGIISPKTIHLPEEFTKAITRVLQDYPVKALANMSQSLSRYLKGRHVPMEHDELRVKAREVHEKVLQEHAQHDSQDSQLSERHEQILRNKTLRMFKKQVYNWEPVKYDVTTCLVYLIGRSAPEYAALFKVMSEISQRDPQFKPNSLFDFGSGIGTATWAAMQFWKPYMFEFYNVDVSRDMNDLALMLLQQHGSKMLKGVFHRQFLPATTTLYDLVVCAYSLFELPNAKTRLKTALNLWNRTGKYLVIVEHGTNAGFKLVNEIRDFILQIDKTCVQVFSPCAHSDVCPRFVANDGTPCNFEVFYFNLPYGTSARHQELYSYVVLKKGEHVSKEHWPRVVRPTLVRSKHCICRMCTADGTLKEVIFTSAKHGKTLYHCARHTEWGDRIPVELENDCDVENV